MKHSYIVLFLFISIFSFNSYALGAKRPKAPSTPVIPSVPATPSNPTSPSASSLNNPWKNIDSTIVIDAYEGNSIDWDKMATDKKVGAVIHRSSSGLKTDSQYTARKKIALQRGYLWGAYHLGQKGNTLAQAKLFLSLVNDEPNTLMILDLEDTGSGSFMTVDEAVVFMNYVYEQTGRTPVVYANQATTVALNSKVKTNPLFQKSKLWYARFKSSVTDFPVGIWSNYFLWQFSSEINCTATGSCLYNVPGTKFDMDVNVFYGPADELAAQWHND
ncbi:MAG: glycoside hydrolase family 25 protein [Bacteriovorax sp.]|nr:glycoside hydrolase family 25 protein [Bacteriovorax sp.]